MIASLSALALFSAQAALQSRPAGYLAEPKRTRNARGVVVLHPWWGLNKDVKRACDDLAKKGYVAFAPDLFEGKTAETEKGAEALVNSADNGKVGQVVERSLTFLRTRTKSPVAVIGFSYGAYWALHASSARPDDVRAVVVFYGTGETEFEGSKAFFMGHFAEKDPFEPEANVKTLQRALRKNGRMGTFYTYPGTGHWFAEPSVAKAYSPKAAGLAWKRTYEFLRKCFL